MPSPERMIVRGFKSIREMDLTFRPLNVLIGANGAGKSNFISVFRLLNQIADGSLQTFVGKAGGAESLLFFGRGFTDRIELEVDFREEGYAASLAPTTDDTLIFESESYWKGERRRMPPHVSSLGKGHSESKLSDGRQRYMESDLSALLALLRGCRVYHLQDTSEKAGVKQTGDLEDNVTLRTDSSNLAAFLYMLQSVHPKRYRAIVETIGLVAPFFRDFALQPSRLNPQKIRLEWRERASDAYFNASALSDGTMRFACLATLLLQPDLPSTIIIDEPELGLHPYALTVLASMLQSAANKSTVIVSTQSVSLVNQLVPDDLVIVDRAEDGQSTFKRLGEHETKEWLDDYGLGDLWEKNLLGGRPQR